MVDLQELITRGRFIFAKAPAKLEVFKLVNGKRNSLEIAHELSRHPNNVRRDLVSILNMGLIQPVIVNGEPLTKDRSFVYEQVPLVREVPSSYFKEPSSFPKPRQVVEIKPGSGKSSKSRPAKLPAPSENEILDIANAGEDQLYEYKAQGTALKTISREICAMLNTSTGGIVLYGIDDDGTIEGSDVTRQVFDQSLQNSVRNMISPAASVELHSVNVMGSYILVIIVPPWNKKDVYQFGGKILIRRGTNVFSASPEEIKQLHKGDYVI
ncbi:MAG: ATP-binding protein [Anaerolineales bacterium]|jgi:hypothetical protein